MKVRVGLGRRFELAGVYYHSGDELDVSAEVAANLIRANLVLPLEDAADALLTASEPPQAPQAHTGPPGPSQAPPEPSQAPSGACGGQCDAGPKPAGARAMQTCPVPGCPCLTWKGKCPAHARTDNSGKAYRSGNRGVPSGRRTTFAALSKGYLRDHPLCESPWCLEEPMPLRPASSEVHHIDSLGLAGPKWNLRSNWLAVCHRCHARYTAQDYGYSAK